MFTTNRGIPCLSHRSNDVLSLGRDLYQPRSINGAVEYTPRRVGKSNTFVCAGFRVYTFSMKLLVTILMLVIHSSQAALFVDAFTQSSSSASSARPTKCNMGALYLARKYIVIGGNIDGVNPNEEEDTYTTSKKERRRREREAGEANFKNGNYKKKKKKAAIVDWDKLEDKVTRERTLLPRENRDTTTISITTNTRKKNKVEKKLSVKAARMKKQRTAGGTVNSATETIDSQSSPEKQAIQIRVAKRGSKTVTMVQGMTGPFKDRKILLKEMKSKLGGGGALVEGVLELQGSHSDKILDILKSKGYSEAKIVGGK